MNEAECERIELIRVRGGLDLWTAIEAAQYSHVIHHDEPRTEAEREAIAAFATSFARWAEEWEMTPQEAQSSILHDLGRQLSALAGCGLSLHAATLDREVAVEGGACVRMPVALLRVSRTAAPMEEMLLPAETRAE